MGKARAFLVSAAALVVGRRRKRRLRPGEREPIVAVRTPKSPDAELIAIGLLLAAAACAIAFVVIYVLDRLPAHTQLLGLALGLAFVFLAAALIVTAKWLVPNEELEDDYPEHEHPHEQERIVQVVEESGLTRRKLFALALGAAGGSIGLALLTPVASLGPAIHLARFYMTPWRRGTRLVNEDGKPYRADEIEEGTFYTAFAEGADKEALASSLVVIRLPTSELDLPPELAGYDARGIVAFSKICTHAGCAIALYRKPLFAPTDPKPALVCPCHYSTFEPQTGGKVIFGPAGRKLPMLPLTIDGKGVLRAKGNFDSPVGPSWWGVRMKKPTT
ncbi:MAG TPA: ubiquinol-cytochrome c reductase iron-sulfur subunit [Gaiellaceae bacterium]|nr:ubiquinol-cytochrome c reductase iron-sulfur subunit [Gaiellaceae bacterium]